MSRNVYQGAEVRKVVRRATQWEPNDEISPDANFVVHGRLFAFSPVSLGVFDEGNQLRQVFVWVITWAWWDRIILLVILMNALMLAITDWSINAVDYQTLQPDPSKSAINAFVDATEPYFTAIFAVEAFSKIVAMGFIFSRYAYLRDSWNVLDFVVVVTGILSSVPGVPNVSVLRAFRVLRPLRALSRVRGLRMMVNSLLTAIPQLINTVVLLAFAFLLWGILALAVFQGAMHSRCRIAPFPVAIPASHMAAWNPYAAGGAAWTPPPWALAGDFEGLLPGAAASPLLNSSTLPPGPRQSLYYEMVQQYLPSSLQSASVIESALAAADDGLGTNGSLPWDAWDTYYVSYGAAANYVWQLLNNRTAFPACGAGQPVDGGSGVWPEAGIPLGDDSWQQDTSPWRTPRQCVWMVDDNDQRSCSPNAGTSAFYTCGLDPRTTDALPSSLPPGTLAANQTLSVRFTPRTCGSNYDAYGNPRFADPRHQAADLWNVYNLNNGVDTFDTFPSTMLAMYQVLTMEGWSNQMYWHMDSYSTPVAVIFFVSFVFIAPFFLLNLVTASIFLNFSSAQVEEVDSLRVRKERVAAIAAVERAEHLRAIGKARLVTQVRSRGLAVKARLRRLSQELHPDELAGLSPAAREAVAASDAMWAAPPDAVAEPPQPPPAVRGVMRRRLQSQLSRHVLEAAPVQLPHGYVRDDDAAGAADAAPAAAAAAAGDFMTGLAADDSDSHSEDDRQPRPLVASTAAAGEEASAAREPPRRPRSFVAAVVGDLAGLFRGFSFARRSPAAVFPAPPSAPPAPSNDVAVGSSTSVNVRGPPSAAAAGWEGDSGGRQHAVHSTEQSACDAPAQSARAVLPGRDSGLQETGRLQREPAPPSTGFSSFFPAAGGGVPRGSVTGSEALGFGLDTWDDGASGASFNTLKSGAAALLRRDFCIPEATPLYLRLRLRLLTFVTSGTFGMIMMILIVFNVATLSMGQYPEDLSQVRSLDAINAMLTLTFTTEMLIRVFALGPRAYAREKLNLFDVFVVALSLLDMGLAPPYLFTGRDSQSTSVLALRTLRLMRIFKLARSWTSLRVLVRTIASAAMDVAFFSCLLGLYIFVFSLLGVHLFANNWRADFRTGNLLLPTDPMYFDPRVVWARSNYDTIWNGVLSTMQLLTMENWTDQLLYASASDGALGTTFIVASAVMGNIVMISLFLAVVLGAFSGLDDPTVKAERDALAALEHAEESPATAQAPLNVGRNASNSTRDPEGLSTAHSRLDARAGSTHSRAASSASRPRRRSSSRPQSAAQRFFERFRAAAAARAAQVSTIVSSLRDVNGTMEMLDLRRRVRIKYGGSGGFGTRRRSSAAAVDGGAAASAFNTADSAGDRGSGPRSSERLWSVTSIAAPPGTVAMRSVENRRSRQFRRGVVISGGQSKDGSASQSGRAMADAAVASESNAALVHGGSAAARPSSVEQPRASTSAAADRGPRTEADEVLSAAATGRSHSADDSRQFLLTEATARTLGLTARIDRAAARSRSASESSSDSGGAGAAGGESGQQRLFAPRLKQSASDITANGQLATARDSDSHPSGTSRPTDVTSLDSLSSLTGSSFSSHGRGTVASAVRTDDDIQSGDGSDEDNGDRGSGSGGASSSDDSDDGSDLFGQQRQQQAASAAGLMHSARGGEEGSGVDGACTCCGTGRRTVVCSRRWWRGGLRFLARLFCCCVLDWGWTASQGRWGRRVVPVGDSPGAHGAGVATAAGVLSQQQPHTARGATSRRGHAGGGGGSKGTSRGRVLLCLQPHHPLRHLCVWLTLQPWFEQVVLCVILASAVALALETPTLDPASTTARALQVLDYVFTVFFSVELVIKVLANGLLFADAAYLRSGWGVLDASIVAVSIFALVVDGNASLRSLRSLRALRALRPLRFITRNPSLRLVVSALLRALSPLFQVLLVCILIFLVFAIVYTSLLAGQTYSCQGPVFSAMTPDQLSLLISPVPYAAMLPNQQAWGSCNNTAAAAGTDPNAACASGYGFGISLDLAPTSKALCLWFGGTWFRVQPQSYDNVLDTMGTLFQLSTTEWWVVNLYVTTDVRGVDMQPVREAYFGIGALWILFMLVAFFAVDLFTSVLVDEYERSRESLGESWLLTDAQKEWVKTQEILLLLQPKRRKRPPVHPTRRAIFWLVTSDDFDRAILAAIVINTCILASASFGLQESDLRALEWANEGFAALFTLEVVLKIYALGIFQYLEEHWHKFDVLVVTLSDLGILVSYLTTSSIGPLATLGRLMRILRVLRLTKSLRTLRHMISALISTIPSVINIAALLTLILFVYAIAGMQLLGNVQQGQNMDMHCNYTNLGLSMLCLWRCLTGESWDLVMSDATPLYTAGCTTTPQWDDPYPNGCGPPTEVVYLYYYSFILITTFTVVELLIAVVLEAITEINDEDSQRLNREELERFAATWVIFDPDCSLFISTTKLRSFLALLPPPMGFGVSYSPSPEEMTALVASLRLPTYTGNTCHFADVSLACARRVIAATIAERGQSFDEVPNTHAIAKRWEKLRGTAVTQQTDWSIQHFVAAECLWSTFRVFRLRRALAL